MFPELNNILNITPENLPKGKSFLVTENEADSTFVLHHFLSLYIRSGFKVCLVGLLHAYNHYRNVATKLRLDLNKAKESGQFVYIDGLKAIGGNFTDNCSKKPDEPLLDTELAGLCLLYNNQQSTLKPIFDAISSNIQSFRSADGISPVLVIVDDISVLYSLGSPARQVLSCVQCVRALVCGDSGGCLVTGMHLVNPENEDGELMLKYLSHQSDCVIGTRGLHSGYSKDVHGEMSLRWKDISQSKPKLDRLSSMQFKITDKNVNFFALGTSAAVL